MTISFSKFLRIFAILCLSFIGASEVTSSTKEKVSSQKLKKFLLESYQMTPDSLEDKFYVNIARRRYKKGIELIRLLNEKILGLDHHFSAMQSSHSLFKLANPNNYTAFQKLLEKMNKNQRKVLNQIAASGQNNPYLMSGFLQSEAFSNLNQEETNDLTCVLDLTSRLFGDLNLIFYETQFLRLTNDDLKNTCQEVFREYTKGIGYKLSLEDCRQKDDWENLHQKLEVYAKEILVLYYGDEADQKRAYKLHSNLNFPINLLLDFIEKYTEFIEEGTKYYRKFELILTSYQKNEICAAQLPERFGELSNEISASISKFNEAYHIAELRGSKLKDLLFVIE